MLTEKQIKVITLYLEGELTAQEIAEAAGYKNRQSVYDTLKREDAKEYMEKIANEAVGEAIAILKAASRKAARKLVDISEGKVEDSKAIYAILNAVNSILEKSGLNTKNIVLEDRKSDKDKLDSSDLDQKLEQFEQELKEENLMN